MNRYLEQALRHYVDTNQKDWDQYLTAVEIAHNNSVQTTTKFTPFYLNYGYHPTFPTNMLNQITTTNVETVQEVLTTMEQTMQDAVANITTAQQRQKKYADADRREVKFCNGLNHYCA